MGGLAGVAGGSWLIGDWIVSLGLAAVFFASIPTGWSVMRHGNAEDPLRREMEKEKQGEGRRGEAPDRGEAR